jgi:hypothetical protein
MGASSSIVIDDGIIPENGKMYKRLNCGCIYSFTYGNYGCQQFYKSDDVEWCLGCWDCLQEVRDGNYRQNNQMNNDLVEQITENQLLTLTDRYGWMTESKAIVYARENRINVVELFQNNNYRAFNDRTKV